MNARIIFIAVLAAGASAALAQSNQSDASGVSPVNVVLTTFVPNFEGASSLETASGPQSIAPNMLGDLFAASLEGSRETGSTDQAWSPRFQDAIDRLHKQIRAMNKTTAGLRTAKGGKFMPLLNSSRRAMKKTLSMTDDLLAVFEAYFRQEKDPESSFGLAAREALKETRALVDGLERQSQAMKHLADLARGRKPA